MTEPVPLASEVKQPEVRTRKPFIVPFHAVIKVVSPIKLLENDKAKIVLGEESLILPVAVSQRERLAGHPPKSGETYHVRLWFRTEDGGVTNLELAGFSALEQNVKTNAGPKKPEFQIAGRLEAVNREEGTLTVKIEPNSKSDLTEAFSVEIWAALELIENVQRLGRTVVVNGEYRPGSSRLVATSLKPKLVGQPVEKKKPKASQE